MIELGAPFISGLLTAVPQIVASWIEARAKVRVAHLQYQIERYPLGIPGQFRRVVGSSGLPTILLSDHNDGRWPGEITPRIREFLGEFTAIGQYARIPSGAFARDDGVHRTIDGEVAARTIARSEFRRDPAILIYFEPGPTTLTAHAYLSAFFDATRRADGVVFLIARYGRSGGPGPAAVRARAGDLPSWQHIDLKAASAFAERDVVAASVTDFVLAAVDAYWRLRFGMTTGLRPGNRQIQPAAAHSRPALTPIDDGLFADAPALRSRLEHEVRGLMNDGYTVTVEELPGGFTGVHVERPKDVVFVVDGKYPATPPAWIRVNGSEDIPLENVAWSPEFRLADILEAIP